MGLTVHIISVRVKRMLDQHGDIVSAWLTRTDKLSLVNSRAGSLDSSERNSPKPESGKSSCIGGYKRDQLGSEDRSLRMFEARGDEES